VIGGGWGRKNSGYKQGKEVEKDREHAIVVGSTYGIQRAWWFELDGCSLGWISVVKEETSEIDALK
jgi:hypothetical protein